MKESNDVSLYLRRLAPRSLNRAGYYDLREILLSYLFVPAPDRNDYKKYIDAVGKKRSIRANNVLGGIHRYVKQCWQHECFRLYWKDLMGYDKEKPPTAMTIIKLICENYEPFMAKHKNLLYETGIYKGNQFEKNA